MKAVRFESYGDIDVLNVVEVPDPLPGQGEVLVRVKAAGIGPGETMVRKGFLHDRWPATFPSGQGGDLAGVVEQTGQGVDDWHAGDEVIGFTNNRASHAQLVTVAAENLTPRPAAVPWDAAGALFGAGCTAWAAVRAVGPSAGDVIVISGAAGGVGTVRRAARAQRRRDRDRTCKRATSPLAARPRRDPGDLRRRRGGANPGGG